MLQANSLAIIVLVVPAGRSGAPSGCRGRRRRWASPWARRSGGLLLAAGGWRLIFFVNVPFGLFGAVAAILLVPRAANLLARVRFDWTGLAIFFPAVVALLSAISFGAELRLGFDVDRRAVRGGRRAGRAVRLARAPGRATRCSTSGCSADARFSTGIASGMGSYLVMFGVLLLVPFYLERGLGLGTARSGLELMAMPLAFGIVAPLAGRLADRVGARPLTVTGMALVAVALGAPGRAPAVDGGVPGAAGGDRGRDGPVHLAQQRLDHGRGARAAGGDGLGRAEHDPGHGHGAGPGGDRDRSSWSPAATQAAEAGARACVHRHRVRAGGRSPRRRAWCRRCGRTGRWPARPCRRSSRRSPGIFSASGDRFPAMSRPTPVWPSRPISRRRWGRPGCRR